MSPTWTDRLGAAYTATCAAFAVPADGPLVLGRRYVVFETSDAGGRASQYATFCTYLGAYPSGAPYWTPGHIGAGATKFLAFLHLAEQEPVVARAFLGRLRQEALR